MCTAATLKTGSHYFGRTLDLEYSYHETVTITPRNYPFRFRRMGDLPAHHAMIGMAYVSHDYPLYYEATNEKGLSMAGLNFPRSAVYLPPDPERDDLAPFELIPWVLGQCGSVAQARALLERVNVADLSFSPELPASPLHWLIADRDSAIVAEPLADGLRICDDPVGVLTNEPSFDRQMFHLNNYRHLTRDVPADTFAPGLELELYSRGMGALGLPGDLSSMSRFVRAAFTRLNSRCGTSEEESVGQFFHILGSVEQTDGCVHLGRERYVRTVYTSCCNTDRGIYYYTTYNNRQITGVDLHREDLDGCRLISYPLIARQQIRMQN